MTKQTIISINPAPLDKRCEVCRKHISKLKPFGKAGDPLVGDFNGALLIKTFRSMAPHLTDKEMKKYKAKNGEENANFYDQLMNTVSASWECRDCIILSDKEYFKKRK